MRRLGLVAVLAAVLSGGVAAPAFAQTDVAPPAPLQTVDQFGVELSSGTIQVSSPTISVGDPANGGLSYTATWDGAARAWRSSIWGGIDRALISPDPYCYAFLTVTVMGQSAAFQQDACTGGYELKDGVGTLTRSGNIWTYTLPDGTVANFDYAMRTTLGAKFSANQGVITSITKPNGEITNFTWIGFGQPRSVTNNHGYQLHFEYSGSTLTKVTALNNAVDPCDPTAAACTYSIAWPSLAFTTSGVERRVTDALNRTTRIIFDGTDPNTAKIVGVARPTTASGSSVTYGHTFVTPFGWRVTSASDGVGTWRYEYEPWPCESPSSCPPPTEDYALTTTVIAPNGGETVYHYFWRYPPFSSGQTIKSLEGVTDANDQTWGLYMDGGGLRSVTYPEGDGVYYARDPVTGVLTSATVSPKPGSGLSNAVTTYAYPACTGSNPILCRRPTSMTDPMGRVTNYAYDAAGNLTSTTEPAPTAGAVRPQTRYAWSQRQAWFKHNGSASITQDANPVWVRIEQSQCATAAASPGCDGAADEVVTTTAYQTGSASVASNILPVSVTSGNGSGTLAATTTTAYDAVRNVLTVNGPLAGTADTTRYVWDAMRQPVGVIGPDPDGAGARLHPATRTTYNADGQVTAVARGTTTGQTDAAWAAFSAILTDVTAYDAQGRKTRETAASGTADATVLQYSYDTSGRLSCTARRMDPADFASLPASACTITSPAGAYGPDRITQTNYDLAGRVLSTVEGYGSGATLTESRTWTANGKVETRTDGNGAVSTYVYDGFDRVSRLRFPNASGGGSSTTDYESYTYDAVGNPLTRRTRGGDVFTTTYDVLNRATRIVSSATGSRAVPDTRFTYDNLDRRLTSCFWASSACTQTVTAAWDALGRQTAETGPLGTVGFGYDLAGRRTSIAWPDAVVATYAWDLSNQVATATVGSSLLATYSYNNLALRTGVARPANTVQTAYGYDAAYRPNALSQDLNGPATTNDQSLAFTRNPASQLTARTVSNPLYDYVPASGTAAYANNGRNQVTSAGGAGIGYDVNLNITNDGTTAYGYDAANRLKSAGPATYAYDPLDRLYQEAATATRRFLYAGDQLIGEYDASGAIQARYVPGPGVDEPLAEYAGSAVTTPIFPVQDERGSVIARTSASGLVGARNTYDEYGRPGPGNAGRFQYTGQVRLTGTDLYSYKARVYAPALGRFLQTDPIGYEAGLNLYAYVGADPVNATDPTGLAGPLPEGGWGYYTIVSSGPDEGAAPDPRPNSDGNARATAILPDNLLPSQLSPDEQARLDPANLTGRYHPDDVEKLAIAATATLIIQGQFSKALRPHPYNNRPDRYTGAQLPVSIGRTYTTYTVPGTDWFSNLVNSRRLVVSNDGLWFYTNTHYRGFQELRFGPTIRIRR